jgi:hypothetical protein
MLVREADKLTFGQALRVMAPHLVEGVLKQPPGKWMMNARLTHYQGLLLDSPRITFADPVTLNPATLLPNLLKVKIYSLNLTIPPLLVCMADYTLQVTLLLPFHLNSSETSIMLT